MPATAYTVRRSDRARRARIVVTADAVELVVPRRMSVASLEPFLASKRPWIERTLRRLRDAQRDAPIVDLRDGGSVPYLGRRLGLSVQVDRGSARSLVRHRGELLEVSLADPGPEALRAALERWYRRRARAEVGARLDAATARAGSRYVRLVVRDQRTRWASCSSSGTMSFNWRLLLAPEEVLSYVVEHEVAHLEVPDHSARFWALLARRCPAHEACRRWLRRHGPALRL